MEVNALKNNDYQNFVLDINYLKFDKGSRWAILGPSGCGKTTLLRILAGLETYQGELDESLKQMIREKKIGFFFQNYALYPHWNALKNIVFGLKMQGYKDIEERIKTISHRLELDGFLNQNVQKLSGGQQQRVALARSLVRDISLLLLDEPLSNLDAPLKSKVLNFLKNNIEERGLTSIYVTHDVQEAFYIADNFALTKEGRVVQSGSRTFLFEFPKNVWLANFLHQNKTNCFPSTIRINEGNRIEIEQLGLEIDDKIKEHSILKNTKECMVCIPYSGISLKNIQSENQHPTATIIKKEQIGNNEFYYTLISSKQEIVVSSCDALFQVGQMVMLEVQQAYFFDVHSQINLFTSAQ